MMINGPPGRHKQASDVERAAIEGWGPTLRLIAIRTVPAVGYAHAMVYMTQLLH